MSLRAGLAAMAVAVIVIVLAVLLLSSGSSTPPAAALPALSHPVGPETIFTPGPPLKSDPSATLDQLRQLGVDRVRVFVPWGEIAPAPNAVTPPAGFNAADPAAYPAAGWAIYDTILRDALARGIGVDFALGPPPPRWASGRGAPDPAAHTYWRPSATDFGQFVRAIGTRYSGHYVPPGSSTPLPRVDFWSIWNEPNLGVQLAPQATDHGQLEVSPELYRNLVDAAWSGLQSTGHGQDTILIGELDPVGSTIAGQPGDFDAMAPLRFLRAMYCVGSDYRPLTGPAAQARGCPPTATGSKAFASSNPALFHASAFADHPYPQGLPPDEPTPDEPDYAVLADMPKLEHTLDTLQNVYGSHTRFPVYSTEFGYQTTPPDQQAGTVSPTAAAYYLNWSEYLTWRDPRLRSYDQYLLTDPAGAYFATGLEFANGTPKPGYAAFRMPIFLPIRATRTGHALEVWGCVRPAHDAQLSTRTAQRVQIQFQPASGGPFQTVRTVTITDRYGYFDVLQKFAGSGTVRLAWSYPHGPEIFSRAVVITLR